MTLLKRIILCVCLFSGFALFANPTADFTLSVKQGCVPLTVSYTDRSTGGVTSYSWDFGNGNRSTLKNPSAIYYKPGNFTVTLTVTDANGKTSVKTFKPIRVFASPSVDFKADTVGCVGDNLVFKDMSVKADTAITKWTWDFGDGNLDKNQNTSHRYTYSGRFAVSLTVVDGFGCKSLKNKANYIRIKPTPKAEFKLDKTYSCMLPGVFNATNKSSGATSYKWLCSDGTSGTGKDFKTSIGSYGKYNVTLIAIGNGCNDTTVYPLNVEKVVAKIDAPAGSLCEGDSLQFTSNSTPSSGLSYYWDFGNGQTADAKSAIATYSSPGSFTVKLRVEAGACKDSTIAQVKINPKPNVTLDVLDSSGCYAPFRAEFKIVGNDYVNSFWNFGDKTNLQNYPKGKPVLHTYTKSGNYKVKALVTNSYGCAVELKVPAMVRIGTQDIFIVPKETYGCIPKFVDYKTNESKVTEPIISYSWVFSDSGTKYTKKEFTKLFTKVGVYEVVLTAITASGCILTDTAEISVGKKFPISFKLLQKDICNKDTIHFINTTDDSIKKKVSFKLTVVDSTGEIYKDSMYKTGKGGRHILKMTANHFGCISESDPDTLYVHGPFLSLSVRFRDCRYKEMIINPSYSWANRALLTKAFFDTLDHRKKEIITPTGGPIILKGWNDTFGCFDTLKSWPGAPIYTPEIKAELEQDCAPAKLSLSHNKTLKDAKWIFPDGTSSNKAATFFIFKKGGKQKVLLAGYFESPMCPDTFTLYFDIEGVDLRGHVFASSKCMPITLHMLDSAAGKDDYLHTWKIGDEEIEGKSLSTLYEMQGLPRTDTFIRVKHIVQSPKGCMSEQEHKLPFGGPIGNSYFTRFTICDTPVFYFKSSIDSSLTKYPVTFKWEMSSGYTSNAQNFNTKFQTMGMNYYNLTITDKEGCKSVFHDSFEVSPNMLMPAFTADPTGRFCPPLQCKFMDVSKTFNSDIVKWEWDFGDGSTSELRNPEKLYLLPGSYDITLKVTSRSGCTAVLKKPGYIIVNGPRGAYDFDRGDGCLPHTVGFRGLTFDSATMEWDLGDGVVRNGNNFKHTYRQRGKYIPAMILTDTLGCKYTMPPIDTIEVFDYPKSITVLEGLCFHQPIKVRQVTISNHDDPNVNLSWFFNGKAKSPGQDSFYMPEDRGMQSVRIVAENKGTCKDTFDNGIKIYAPVANFDVDKDFVCLGSMTEFHNRVTADTTVVSYAWDFGDGTQSNSKETRHLYARPGEYNVRLIAKDILNCADTITRPEIAVVGDTVSPPIIPIRRASVLNNREIELVFAKYPTFDFTRYIIYREANNKYYKMGELGNIDDTVFVDRQCNTLDASYCYKVSSQNLCLYVSDVKRSKEHCTIETKAFGQLDANRVSWSPYIGFDSIARYQIWRQDYDHPGSYELIDSVQSTRLIYIDTLITCNTRKNYRIKAIQEGGFREYSNSDTATAKPYYFNTTKPNYTWRTTVENNEYSRVEWLNNAWSRNGIKGYMLYKTFANGDPVFSYKYFDALDSVFDDKQVKVNDNSYIYYVRGIDKCGDTTPVSNIAQTILLTAYFDQSTQKPALKWNFYRVWDQKVAYYEIEQKQEDGTFLLIGKVSAGENTFIDMNAKSNCSPMYVYRVRAVSYVHTPTGNTAVSLSNEARAYPASTLFVPDAFSPDMNGINEKFGPKGQYISKYKIQVFNRWGEKLFETTDCMQPWDGTYKNERCQQDVYMYHIEAMGADNKTYVLNGTFTLLR